MEPGTDLTKVSDIEVGGPGPDENAGPSEVPSPITRVPDRSYNLRYGRVADLCLTRTGDRHLQPAAENGHSSTLASSHWQHGIIDPKPPEHAGYDQSEPPPRYVPRFGPEERFGYAQDYGPITTQPAVCQSPVVMERPGTMVPAILVCLFCFWPLAIAAIHYASSATAAYDAGNYELAQKQRRNSVNMIILSMLIGGLCILFIVLRYTVLITNDSAI